MSARDGGEKGKAPVTTVRPEGRRQRYCLLRVELEKVKRDGIVRNKEKKAVSTLSQRFPLKNIRRLKAVKSRISLKLSFKFCQLRAINRSRVLRVVCLHEKCRSVLYPLDTDAHYVSFWRGSAAITAELPWTSVGVAMGYRENPRVSTASVTAHGTSTENATVVATARAAVLSVANSVVPTMENHFAAIATAVFADVQPKQFPRPSAAVRGYCHGNSLIRGNCHVRPRKSAAIAAARAAILLVANSVVPTMPTAVSAGTAGARKYGLRLGLVPWFRKTQ